MQSLKVVVAYVCHCLAHVSLLVAFRERNQYKPRLTEGDGLGWEMRKVVGLSCLLWKWYHCVPIWDGYCCVVM